MQAYKGTDANGRCQGFQYEVGKDYKIDGRVKLCARGFHACENPLDVLSFYPPCDSRFYEVEQNGDKKTDEIKTVASEIKIKAEIGLFELIKAGVEYLIKHTNTKTAQGNRGHAVARC